MKNFVAIVFLITILGCQNSLLQPEEVKQDKIATRIAIMPRNFLKWRELQ